MASIRKRLDRRRTYCREDAGDEPRPRAVRLSKRADDLVVEVHVHNELPQVIVAAPGERASALHERTPLPRFSGELYSWREHYHPLFQKIIPVMTERQARRRKLLARVARLTLWGSVLAALTTLGCNYLGS